MGLYVCNMSLSIFNLIILIVCIIGSNSGVPLKRFTDTRGRVLGCNYKALKVVMRHDSSECVFMCILTPRCHAYAPQQVT